jgi:hypothetical protein
MLKFFNLNKKKVILIKFIPCIWQQVAGEANAQQRFMCHCKVGVWPEPLD